MEATCESTLSRRRRRRRVPRRCGSRPSADRSHSRRARAGGGKQRACAGPRRRQPPRRMLQRGGFHRELRLPDSLRRACAPARGRRGLLARVAVPGDQVRHWHGQARARQRPGGVRGCPERPDGWRQSDRAPPSHATSPGTSRRFSGPSCGDFATSVHGGEGPVNALTVMVEDTDIAYAIRSGSPEAENMLLNLLVAGGHHPGATGRGGRLARAGCDWHERTCKALSGLRGLRDGLHRKPPRGRCVRSGVRGSALPAHAPDTVVTEPVEKGFWCAVYRRTPPVSARLAPASGLQADRRSLARCF